MSTSTPCSPAARRVPQFSSGASPWRSTPVAGSFSSPVWASTTTTSHRSTSRSRFTSAFPVSSGERKRRPAQFAESSSAGTAGVVSPTTPTRTPARAFTIEAPKARLPSGARTTLAASQGKPASACARASPAGPQENSWFPTAIAS